ncbi:MAG: ABC transporter ATP-binding protein [Spirochaetota bacterium]
MADKDHTTPSVVLAAAGCGAAYGAAPPAELVFADISFQVASGEIVTIVGPSGSGKSTLLLVLSGLKAPVTGRVKVEGRAVNRGDPRIGLVLQHYGLFPWYTVLRNATLGLELRSRGRPRARPTPDATPDGRERKARALLEHFGLAGKEHRFPRELSGGEQQRVALARTLLLEPQVLLLDEPFSALDALTREELQDRLLNVLGDSSMGVVMVTHSVDEAVYLGHRVGILAANRGPAGLTVIDNPHPPRVRESGRRTDPAYHRACVVVRERFREVLGA